MMNHYSKNILQAGIVALELAGDGTMHHSEVGELVALGVPYRSAAIMGRPLTGSDRKRFSLIAGRLERAKLIRRVRALDGRATHLQLTDDGIDAGVEAVRADGCEPDFAALDRGIELVKESWKLTTHKQEGNPENDRSTKTSKPTRTTTTTGRRRNRRAA